MNTRCYRCGWSFSMSREALEEAAVSGAGQKAHVIHCPRCRQTIRVPMDQILRALPAGWTPNPAAENSTAAPAAASETQSVVSTAPEPEAAAAADRSPRRHRHSSKSQPGDSAAVPAAKNSTHPN